MERTSRPAVFVLVAAIIIVGCGGGDPEPVAGPSPADAPPPEAAVSDTGGRVMTGLCVVGHEVRTFIPCGSEKVYWMQADQRSYDAFQVALGRFTDEPYEPFSATLVGRLEGKAEDGFAADYDGQVFIEKLIRLAPASELDCDQ